MLMLAMAVIVFVAVMAVIVFVDVSDFGFVGALFVTLMCDPVVRVHVGEKRRADTAAGKVFAGRAGHGFRSSGHAFEFCERAAVVANVFVKGHRAFPIAVPS